MSGTPAGFAAARRRLLLMIILVVMAILVSVGVAVYATDAHAVDQQIAQELTDRAAHESQMGGLTELPSTTLTTPTVEQDPRETYEPSSPNVFVMTLNQQEQIVFDPSSVAAQGLPDRSAARPVLSGASASTMVTVTRGAHAFQLLTMPLKHNGVIVGVVQVGMSLDPRDRQLSDLLTTLTLVDIGALALATLAGFFLADRAMAPARLAFERQRQFAAAASHELRTPLAIVRSQAELIARRLRRATNDERSGELAQDADEVVAEVEYMTRLVTDLLLLARDAPDARGLASDPVDLVALARDVTGRLAPLAAQKSITLTATEMPEECVVAGDQDRLRQVMLVLLENALRYTPAGGQVRVRVWRDASPRVLGGPRVRVSVSDTGIGIAPDQLRRIFEPFYRGDPARTEADGHQGAGLGLPIAQWIARAHGGEISVHSAPGHGSVFTLLLPSAEE